MRRTRRRTTVRASSLSLLDRDLCLLRQRRKPPCYGASEFGALLQPSLPSDNQSKLLCAPSTTGASGFLSLCDLAGTQNWFGIIISLRSRGRKAGKRLLISSTQKLIGKKILIF